MFGLPCHPQYPAERSLAPRSVPFQHIPQGLVSEVSFSKREGRNDELLIEEGNADTSRVSVSGERSRLGQQRLKTLSRCHVGKIDIGLLTKVFEAGEALLIQVSATGLTVGVDHPNGTIFDRDRH
jgi:hypothetical protein